MIRVPVLPIVMFFLSTLLFAQATQEASSPPSMNSLAAAIQSEFVSHGDRVLGNGIYGWSTRLNKIEECRAEFSVRVTNNFRGEILRTETVNFSLGAIEPYGIELKKNWLDLPCAHNDKCIFSTTICSSKSADGIVVDCSTAGQKRVDSIDLEFDGDLAAAARLEQAFRQAVDLCRTPKPVTF